jgi:DNA modification methylase
MNQTETVPVSTISPDPSNARKHDQRNLDAIRGSLARFGQQKPIVVDEAGVVVAGNGTLEAAKALGWQSISVVRTKLKNADRTAFAIADNRTGELAGWDNDALYRSLKDLEAYGVDLDVDVGFDLKDVHGIEGALGLDQAKQDEVPPVPEDAVTKTGDMIVMGNHRLKCGDATNKGDVAHLLGDAEPFMMVTDPPYGVEYDPNWRNEAAEKGQLSYADRRIGVVHNDDNSDWSTAYDLFRGAVAYTWSPGGDPLIAFGLALQKAGFQIRNQIIWVKAHFPISRGHYTYQHEPCWYAVRKGQQAKWVGDGKASTRWDVTLDKNVEGGHSTQKPVECMARPIRNHGNKDDDVYDPFLGSGTTVVAAEQLGRRCFGLEIDPRYCDVIIQRWENLTGGKAVRNG